MQRGAQCPTDGCPGTVTYSALQSGREANPISQELLVHREKRQEDDLREKEKARHVKAKKKDKDRPKEHPKPAGDISHNGRSGCHA